MEDKNIRILIVDDFEMVRVLLKNALNDLGFFNLEEAENGRIALEKLKDGFLNKKPFSIIFCDWTMPEVTGMEVLEHCRNAESFKDLPFIMVTAEAEQDSVVRAIKAGATDYLVKPISPEILEKKIKKILSRLSKPA